MTWKNDAELFAMARRELFTAVIGDVMDRMNLRRQFLPPAIQPLDRSMVVIGRAMTVLEEDIAGDTGDNGRPFGRMLEALDDLRENEVYTCTGGSSTYALWGELMSARAIRCGTAGAILDGCSRDTRGVLALGFPTFSYGSYAQDQAPRGRAVDVRVPLQIGQARVSVSRRRWKRLSGSSPALVDLREASASLYEICRAGMLGSLCPPE